MIGRAIAGFVMGILAAGIIISIGTAAGLPSGPGWWAVIVPFLVFMTYAGAITK